MTTTALTVTQRAAVALRSPEAEAHLIALVAGTKDITAPTNKAGRDQCHGAAMAALKARTAIVSASKTARADATAFGKAVIAEESRLVAIIEPEELRLKGLRDEWDAEQARIKAEAEKAEAERVSSIMCKIDFIRDQPARFFSASVEDTKLAIVDLDLMLANGGFQEFQLRAMNAADDAKALLASMIEAKEAAAAEAARVAEGQAKVAAEQAAARAALEAEREELKRIMAAKEAARKAEREKEAAEQAKRDAEAAEQRRIERENLDAEREQFQAEQAAFAAARIAAEAAERAERDRIAAERAVIEAAKEAEAKAVRDAEESARRVEAEKEADRRRATSQIRQQIDRALDGMDDSQLRHVLEFAERMPA